MVLTEGSSEEDPAKIWVGCQLRVGGRVGGGGGCGAGAEDAAIFLHEDDSDRAATKRMACHWE